MRKIAFKDITLKELKGKGSYGEVYEGIYRGEKVAVKKISAVSMAPDMMRHFYKEVEVWR